VADLSFHVELQHSQKEKATVCLRIMAKNEKTYEHKEYEHLSAFI
jgi:hypothetical protein